MKILKFQNICHEICDKTNKIVHMMIEEIEDNRKNQDAVSKEQETITTPLGLQKKEDKTP